MADNIVYEISRLMNDQAIMRNDLNAAAGLVADMFRKKYIDRLNDNVNEHRKRLTKNPPKEVQLINVLKQFMPEEKHAMADKAIDVIIMANTLARLGNELPGSRPTASTIKAAETQEVKNESSIHPDGVYDVDINCVKKKEKNEMTGMLLAMALLTSKL